MAIIAEIDVPADAFNFGTTVEQFPDAHIEFERVVPLDRATAPMFWFKGGDVNGFETALADNSHIQHIKRVIDNGNEALFEVEWRSVNNGFIDALLQNDATILKVEANNGKWELRLQFDSHNDLSHFSTAVTECGMPITLLRIYRPDDTSEEDISIPQQEALELAHRKGYFDVPRQTTLSELANELDISEAALSQRLRRGTAQVIESRL